MMGFDFTAWGKDNESSSLAPDAVTPEVNDMDIEKDTVPLVPNSPGATPRACRTTKTLPPSIKSPVGE
jgi:hypothetical protein